jgi:hypothetical protein
MEGVTTGTNGMHGEVENRYKGLVGNLKERGPLEDLSIDNSSVILKLI